MTESLHTFGLTLLVFRVLPKLDVLRAVLLLCAVGVIPAILKPVTAADVAGSKFSRSKTLRGVKTAWEEFLDFLALVGQASVFVAVYMFDYVDTNSDGVLSKLDIAGAMLVSVANWENYMDGKFFVKLKETNALRNFMLKVWI